MVSNRVVEEPISSELVLVDQALARRARAALPDPPWLLPVLAELRARPSVEPAVPVPARPPARRRRPSVASVVLLVGGLAATVVLSLAFFPLSRGPSLVTTPAERAAPAVPARPPAVRDPKPVAKAKAKPKPKPKRKPARVQPPSKQKETGQRPPPVAKTHTKPPARKPAPTPKPRPRALTRAQRTVAWGRYPSAVYYEVYLQSGAKTLYETRTLQPGAVLPASITLKPGAYQVLVRPAVPGDAGIILGPAIVRRTIRL